MILELLQNLGQLQMASIALLVAFGFTALLLHAFCDKLPQDQGREFAVNGQLSKGKARGAGVLFIPAIALMALVFVPFSIEFFIYMVLLVASMLSGYLDDAAQTPWNEYKKGLIDFAIALIAGITYVGFNPSAFQLFGMRVSIPAPLYVLLAVVLIWTSINVTNCTDGVDGLSSMITLVTLATFLIAFYTELGDFANVIVVFVGGLLAYLWCNVSPSTLMMGDAGSRAIGFFIAVVAMKSGHPVAYVLAALVFILDGGLGILKISLKRFLKIWILKNIRTPLHDEARKNRGWSDSQVVLRFAMLQVLISAVLLLIVS
ncbi:MAG: phospho-N-acetylmuramoyl-pentapeptide-transferase [Faecalibacterium sp.]